MARFQATSICQADGCEKAAAYEVIAKNGSHLGKFCYWDAQRAWQRQEKKERGIGRFARFDGDLPPDHR